MGSFSTCLQRASHIYAGSLLKSRDWWLIPPLCNSISTLTGKFFNLRQTSFLFLSPLSCSVCVSCAVGGCVGHGCLLFLLLLSRGVIYSGYLSSLCANFQKFCSKSFWHGSLRHLILFDESFCLLSIWFMLDLFLCLDLLPSIHWAVFNAVCLYCKAWLTYVYYVWVAMS